MKNREYKSAVDWIEREGRNYVGTPAKEVYRQLPSYLRARCTERSFCVSWWQRQKGMRVQMNSTPVLSNTFHSSVSSTRQEVLNLISDLEKAVALCAQLGLKFTTTS